jgi:hypothetical protein
MRRPTITAAACVALLLGTARATYGQDPSRLFLGLSGLLQATNDFRDNVTFVLNAESGDLDAQYRVGTGRLFDADVGARIWRDLVAGVSVSYFEKQGQVDVDARLPHPFFFNRSRTVSGEADAIRRTEVAVHPFAGWLFAVSDRIDVLVSGGPSYIRLRQSLVEQVTFSEVFPFNSATFTGVSTAATEDGSFGMHAGADLTMKLYRHFGVGTRLRFSRASVAIDSPDGDRVSVDAGGFQIVAGVRARF